MDKAQAGMLSPTQRKDLAITLGISSEKTMLLAGHPTAIVAGMHEVRHAPSVRDSCHHSCHHGR